MRPTPVHLSNFLRQVPEEWDTIGRGDGSGFHGVPSPPLPLRIPVIRRCDIRLCPSPGPVRTFPPAPASQGRRRASRVLSLALGQGLDEHTAVRALRARPHEDGVV
ncbi:hypothetical protein K376_05928 [Streptomyces sp. PsTaAH-130]|nr:hypothetical protein K376_05928 [Streptomyces sp. PsTaAH-130]